MKTADYRDGLIERLKSPRFARRLLQKALDESCEDGNWEAYRSTGQQTRLCEEGQHQQAASL